MKIRHDYGRRRSGKSGRLLFLVLVGAAFLYFISSGAPDLEPYHTEKLSEEFDLDRTKEVTSFAQYLDLEDRLFEELKRDVYSQTETGPGFEIDRYSLGSAADPFQFTPDWNRSFEMASDPARGGVLLLHGMSDSPYSLRALAKRFNDEGFWVVGLRLPGHGTAPSGLVYIAWEDLAAAVDLAMAHLQSRTAGRPLHIVGYSNGAPLALDHVLDTLETAERANIASLVLISPAIGVHRAAGLAKYKDWLGRLPGLGHLSWLSVDPEFDPFKYNSFATNAGTQVHLLTRSVNSRIRALQKTGQQSPLPPILVFKSTVDATVSVNAVLDNLLMPLGASDNKLVLFDINRHGVESALLIDDPGPLTNQLMGNNNLPFSLSLLTNRSEHTRSVEIRTKQPFSSEITDIVDLDQPWPAGVISLSHVALPFPTDDPIYGQYPPEDEGIIFLGQMGIQGEHGLLKISTDWLLRLRHNPFYDYLEDSSVQWLLQHSAP